ncbi:MAG TPA: hypothetical protein VFP61_03665 [Acidimicrobiales bacterium]|nr:hypothetical protein [Acidimicrobiales bacterium]
MTGPRSPLDAALDLVVFAPVGLALTLGEELPKLAARGRSTVTARVTVARVVGQFAVTQGRREVERRLRPQPPAPPHPAPAAATTATSAATGPATKPAAVSTNGHAPAAVAPAAPAAPTDPPTPAPARAASASTAAPAAGRGDDLAIPSYDALSASQVVARLAALSHDELESVKRYEAATRGRRTILARVAQLQG